MQILMNKPVYLGLSILVRSELNCNVWTLLWFMQNQNMVKKNCYMDTGSFIVHGKTDDIYKSIEEDVDKRFDSSNSELKKPLSKK